MSKIKENDVLERAMDFEEVKEPTSARKAEIEEQNEIARKKMLREKEIYKAIAMFAIHGDD